MIERIARELVDFYNLHSERLRLEEAKYQADAEARALKNAAKAKAEADLRRVLVDLDLHTQIPPKFVKVELALNASAEIILKFAVSTVVFKGAVSAHHWVTFDAIEHLRNLLTAGKHLVRSREELAEVVVY